MDAVILTNRLKMDEYHIYKTYTAGIVLKAKDIKQVLNGSCSLRGSYACMYNNVLSLIKMYIEGTGYENRNLLLKKSEIKRLMVELSEGRILIPRSVFKINNLIKIDLILCSKIAKFETKKRDKIRKMDIKEARMYNVLKIRI